MPDALEIHGPPDPRKRKQAMADLAKATFKVLREAFPEQTYGGVFKHLAGPPAEGIVLTWTGEVLMVRACGYEFEAGLRLTATQEAQLLDRLLARRRLEEDAQVVRELIAAGTPHGPLQFPDECADDASG